MQKNSTIAGIVSWGHCYSGTWTISLSFGYNTCFRHRICGGTSINTTICTSTKPQSFNSVLQFFY